MGSNKLKFFLCRRPSSIVVISTCYHHPERYSLFFFLGFDFLSHFFVCLPNKEKKNMRGGRRKSEKEMKKEKKQRREKEKLEKKEGKKQRRRREKKIGGEEEEWISFCIFFFLKHLCNVACCLVILKNSLPFCYMELGCKPLIIHHCCPCPSSPIMLLPNYSRIVMPITITCYTIN